MERRVPRRWDKATATKPGIGQLRIVVRQMSDGLSAKMKLWPIIAVLVLAVARADEPQVEHITYDEFVKAVETGRIKQVHFYNLSGIEGTMAGPQGEIRFDTARGLPTSNDPLLLRLLKANNVTFDQSDEPKFPTHGFGYSSWQLMQLGFLMTAALIVFAILQLRVLRRLEKKVGSPPALRPPEQPPIDPGEPQR